MSSIQNFYTSRDNNTDGNTYVGQLDRLWYNPVTNSLFVSDGTTPGGVPVALATGANIVADNISLNSITARSGDVTFDGNLVLNGRAEIAGNISPAATNKIGGIAPGPGVVISNEGILTIDTANLPLSFGNFTASNNVLSITNVDENMILQTEGSAEIQLVGNIGFYKPDGIPPDVSNRYAFFNNDGQATFYIPVTDPAEGAFKIVGSASGNFTAPLNTGVMLQVTGQNNDASRIYNDSIGGFAALVGRRLNGTTGSPTPVLNNEELMRLTAVGHNGTAFPTGAGQRIGFRALGTQSLTNGGGAIEFWTTPLNSTTIGQVATVDTANGVNATKFTTSGTVSATGNITGGNIVTAGTVNSTGNVSGGNITTVGVTSATGNIITAGYFVGNGATITGINAFGNIYANGVAILATSGSGALIMTPGNNVVILGDNGTKTATISVKDAPSFTGNVTGGNLITTGLTSTGNLSATGAVTVTPANNSVTIAPTGTGTVTINPATIGNIANVYVNLAAGTSSLSPLTFAAGTILTAPVAGSLNYDGSIFYATPSGAQRGLIRTAQTYVPNANYTLLNQTAVQSMFGVAATVSSNTRYGYSIYAIIYKTANNITLGFAQDGNAVLARHTWQSTTTATTTLSTLSTPSLLKNAVTSAFDTPTVITPALNGTGYYSVQITGQINVTTGGTWNPLISFSGLPGAGSYLAASSSVELWPLGTATGNISIGTWA